MKKFFALTLLTLLYVGSAEAQLLYKISGNGLKKESYIIGTYHLAPASFVDSIVGAREALESVDAVCGELDMSALDGDAQLLLNEAMMLPDGEYITDILTEDQLTRLNAYMLEVLGMDFNKPMCKRMLGRYRPAALAMNLEVAAFSKITPDFNPLKLIDNYFQQEAQKMGKQVLGLETVEAQIEVLFGTSSIDEEILALMEMVDNPEATHEAMMKLADAYFAQDFKAISKCVTADLGDSVEDTEEWERICVNRNYNWIAQMPAIMEEQPTLFVVGAAHLVGKDGVLTLLKREGYKVKAVK
jgi:uncharacterized protein YbaP (TraB family)